jgi:hypothetical protein
MLAATVIGIFIIPVSFFLVERFTMRLWRKRHDTGTAAPAPAPGD